jgi:hypothetical protein
MREVARNMRAKPRAAILFIEPPGRPWIAGPASMDAFLPQCLSTCKKIIRELINSKPLYEGTNEKLHRTAFLDERVFHTNGRIWMTK